MTNVVDKLSAAFSTFNLTSFGQFLGQGLTAYDGSNSTVGLTSITSPGAAAQWSNQHCGATTVSAFFRACNGSQVNALTSVVSSSLTIYMSNAAISTKNGGNNANNFALLFHEGLHGFGGSLGGTSYFDSQLQAALGLKVNPKNTRNITDYIKKHCF